MAIILQILVMQRLERQFHEILRPILQPTIVANDLHGPVPLESRPPSRRYPHTRKVQPRMGINRQRYHNFREDLTIERINHQKNKIARHLQRGDKDVPILQDAGLL